MPAPIPTAVADTLFGYQFHQVAIYCPSGVASAVALWEEAGYTNWIIDHAELKGLMHLDFDDAVNGEYQETVTKATMAFNYDIMPMELEFLHYEGPSRWSHMNWAGQGRRHDPFITHMSTYVDDVIWETKRVMEIIGRPPFHRFITQNHSNPGVVGKKRFIESIFHTRHILGYDLKLIQKVDWDYPDEAWLGARFD